MAEIDLSAKSRGAVDPAFPGFLLCTVNQLLARLGVNLLLAVKALAEPGLGDPFQCRVDCTQQRSVPRFLAEVYFPCQKRVRAVTLVLAVVTGSTTRAFSGTDPGGRRARVGAIPLSHLDLKYRRQLLFAGSVCHSRCTRPASRAKTHCRHSLPAPWN